VFDVADPELAGSGSERIDWAARGMPVLAQIGERFAATRPLKGLGVAACMHVTAETANLMRVLQAGGASVALAASNPLSTQDDTAAALVRDGVAVFARRGVDRDGYYAHIAAALDSCGSGAGPRGRRRASSDYARWRVTAACGSRWWP